MADGVKSALSDQGGASRQRQSRLSFGQTSPAKKLLNEGGITDPFAFLANYITLEIPVSCGSKTAKVYAFFHKSHMDPHLTDIYKRTISGYIEKKKWIESEKKWIEAGRPEAKVEVGPTVAIARMIECGDYSDFLQIFKNRNFELKPMEHVLLVVEDGKYRHLLPTDDLCAFRNAEQLGIIGYSILEALKAKLNGFKDLSEEQIKEAREWITTEERRRASGEWVSEEEGKFNARAFRQLLNLKENGGCRVNEINGERFTENVIVLEGLLQKVKEMAKKGFDSEEIIELEDEVGSVVEPHEAQETSDCEAQASNETNESATGPINEPIILMPANTEQIEKQ